MSRVPWVLVSAGPYIWPSHEIIRPSLLKALAELPVHVEEVLFTQTLPADLAKRIRRNASCLILPLSVEEGLGPVLEMRRKYRLDIPCVMMIAGQMARGGLAIMSQVPAIRPEDHFVTACEAEYDLVRAAFPQANIHLIPLPVLSEEMSPLTEAQRKSFRKSVGVGPAEKMLVYAGRISCQKNIHGLLHLISEARKKHPRLKLFVLGSVDDQGVPHLGIPLYRRYHDELNRLAGDLNLQNHVIYTGALPRSVVRKFLASCDAHVSLTLNFEDYGYAIAEGLHCGAPTLVTDWGGPADFIRGEGASAVAVSVTKNGPRVDQRGAVRSLLEMLTPAENRKWRKNATQFVHREISKARVIAGWKTLLSSLKPAVSPGGIELNARFGSFQLEYLSRKSKLRAMANRIGFAAYHPIFSSSAHPLYVWICQVYAGQKEVDGDCASLHPFFSIDTGLLNDPLVEIREFHLSAPQRARLRHWFGKTGSGKIAWKQIKTSAWVRKLKDQGVILVFS